MNSITFQKGDRVTATVMPGITFQITFIRYKMGDDGKLKQSVKDIEQGLELWAVDVGMLES